VAPPSGVHAFPNDDVAASDAHACHTAFMGSTPTPPPASRAHRQREVVGPVPLRESQSGTTSSLSKSAQTQTKTKQMKSGVHLNSLADHNNGSINPHAEKEVGSPGQNRTGKTGRSIQAAAAAHTAPPARGSARRRGGPSVRNHHRGGAHTRCRFPYPLARIFSFPAVFVDP
jgi:hypothetical protein